MEESNILRDYDGTFYNDGYEIFPNNSQFDDDKQNQSKPVKNYLQEGQKKIVSHSNHVIQQDESDDLFNMMTQNDKEDLFDDYLSEKFEKEKQQQDFFSINPSQESQLHYSQNYSNNGYNFKQQLTQEQSISFFTSESYKGLTIQPSHESQYLSVEKQCHQEGRYSQDESTQSTGEVNSNIVNYSSTHQTYSSQENPSQVSSQTSYTNERDDQDDRQQRNEQNLLVRPVRVKRRCETIKNHIRNYLQKMQKIVQLIKNEKHWAIKNFRYKFQDDLNDLNMGINQFIIEFKKFVKSIKNFNGVGFINLYRIDRNLDQKEKLLKAWFREFAFEFFSEKMPIYLFFENIRVKSDTVKSQLELVPSYLMNLIEPMSLDKNFKNREFEEFKAKMDQIYPSQ